MKPIVWILPTFLVSLTASTVAAQTPAIAAAEARVAHAYDAARVQGPEALRAFLAEFPKGADLHVHLSGAVYAETFLREAGEDGLCVDPEALALVKPPCNGKFFPASELGGNITPARQVIYDKMIDSLSMRGFVPSAGWTGHDQFFATFGRFGGLKKEHAPEWVDEVAARAAAQNQQYLEIMQTPPFSHAARIGYQIGWPTGEPDFAALRQKLLDAGLRDEVATNRQEMLAAETGRKALEHCGTPQAAPACQVEIRYLYQILRGNPPEQVFAQTLLGFETVSAALKDQEKTFVGINFVQPEDGLISMRDYTLQMHMLAYLHSVYPQVHLSLHAGELVEGMVPPEGMRFHIRQAVELAHAERIGHGVDVMHEDKAPVLLNEMAEKHVMVEINLSSNEGILGVKGTAHPFPLYRAAHVPVALSTDDEGVSRIDLTREYVRAAFDYGLSYNELKTLARTGIAHSFLPGADLWATPDNFSALGAACKADPTGSEHPSAACAQLLQTSEKAAAEWELEHRFRNFEAQW
jgi:adenosine deaminase